MVESTLHVALVAFHVCLGIRRVPGQCSLAVTHAVRFDIGLGHYIDTILVAQVIPKVVVGIMAGTHGIQVELLHQLDVLQHALARYHIAAIRIHFVTVGTLEEYRLPVNQNLGILQFYFAETHFHGNHFKHLVALLQRRTQGIKIRCFSCPFVGRLYLEYFRYFARRLQRFGCHRFLTCVKQFQFHQSATFHAKVHFQCTVAILRIKVGSNTNVRNLFLIAGIQVTITSYSAVTEEVLVFQICSVAPAEHLESNQVFLSGLQIRSQVEFSFQLAVFAITYITAVYPQIHVGSYRTEVCNDFLAFPVGRNHYLTAIRTHMVVFFRHEGRIVPIAIAPGIAYIHINGITIAIQFPNTRYRHIGPAFIIETGLPEIGRTRISIFHPEELPGTVQRHKVRRMFLYALSGGIGRFVSEITGVHGRAVHGINLRVTPFLEGLGTCRKGSGSQQPCQK